VAILTWIILHTTCHSHSILHWKRVRKKSVWMKVPIAQSYLIPVAFNYGFSYHHVVGDYAMLLKWFPGRQSKVAPYATHQVGVSGNCNQYCIFHWEHYGFSKYSVHSRFCFFCSLMAIMPAGMQGSNNYGDRLETKPIIKFRVIAS